MNNFFEFGLPDQAPYWLNAKLIPEFQAMLGTVKERMQKLNAALDLTSLQGEVFAKFAKVMFDNSPEHFDAMSAEEIAEGVNLLNDGKPVSKRIEWPNATVIVDTAFVTRHEWESLRHFGIGGSDAAVIMGTSKWETRKGLYNKKIGTPTKARKTENNDAVFDRGHAMEDTVIAAFCEKTGAVRIPETRMFASKKNPCATANIDAIVQFPDGQLFVFEAKTTIVDNKLSWTSGKIPPYYVPQTRQYPAVLDDPRIKGTFIGCLFTADNLIFGNYVSSTYDKEQFVLRYVRRDAEDEEEQLKAEQEFFEDYIEMNFEPEETGSPDAELNNIKAQIGPADKSLPVLNWDLDDYKDVIDKYMALSDSKALKKAELEEIEKQMKGLSVDMIATLGQNVEANIELTDNMYYEIKNNPIIKAPAPDMEVVSALVASTAPYIPTELLEKLEKAIKPEKVEAYRTFTIKEKQHKKTK